MSKSKEKCLVLGGGGFIGSHLSEGLIKAGYFVVVFDKLNFSKRNIEHIKSNISVIEGDFNNEIDVKKSLEDIDYVFHLVSSTLPASSNQNPIYDVETNLISSLMLFDESIKKNVKKIIFISSGGTVYGIPNNIPIKEDNPRHPICSYGIIKKTIEDYLFMYNLLHGLDYNVFRLSNPYGERQNPLGMQGAIPVFLRKIVEGGCDHSYGIQVAQLAGLPKTVIDRAKEVLANLESEELTPNDLPKLAVKHDEQQNHQLDFFSRLENSLREKIDEIDLNNITPLEALNILNDLKKISDKSS